MMRRLPITFESPRLLVLATAISLLACLVVIVRRPDFPRMSRLFGALGLVLLSLAAGGALWLRPAAQEVAIMVDLSPSTRGAEFRDSATLRRRIGELLGDTPYQLIFFSDTNRAGSLNSPLDDIPADRTLFAPPPAAAVVLFSDARFERPAAAPPTYVVIDPMLEDARDAAVSRLELRGDNVAATIANSGPPRQLTLHFVTGPSTAPSPTGTIVITRAIDQSADSASAQLSPGDRWPENDSLSIRTPPPATAERWWVGNSSAPANWRHFAAGDLPTDPLAYLAPAVIVLDNVPADAVSDLQQDRLRQYIRDLGGGLVIFGGDHAFAAGGYAETTFEDLSPLSSVPPTPQNLWMLLVDGSGSMATDVSSGGTRWAVASAALVKMLGALPPADPVKVGQFSEALQWWPVGPTAKAAAAQSLPPAGAAPHGPTNLEPALSAIAADASLPVDLPKQLLLITDADTHIDHPDRLIEAFRARKIHLNLLAVGEGSGSSALNQIVQATGGHRLDQLDPKRWSATARQLVRAAQPSGLETEPIDVRFVGGASKISPVRVSLWNRTWLKQGPPAPTHLADAQTRDEPITPVAEWQVGYGKVLAAAFRATGNENEALAALVARPPHDPRFAVRWESGAQLHVTIDAVDRDAYLNGLDLRADLAPADSTAPPRSVSIPQTAPGRYELDTAARREPTFLTVRNGEHVIERFAVAGRYPPEFDAIGNDRAAMKELASRTGGAVIEPEQKSKIEFNWPRRDVPLLSWLAAAGASMIAIALVRWRIA